MTHHTDTFPLPHPKKDKPHCPDPSPRGFSAAAPHGVPPLMTRPCMTHQPPASARAFIWCQCTCVPAIRCCNSMLWVCRRDGDCGGAPDLLDRAAQADMGRDLAKADADHGKVCGAGESDQELCRAATGDQPAASALRAILRDVRYPSSCFSLQSFKFAPKVFVVAHMPSCSVRPRDVSAY